MARCHGRRSMRVPPGAGLEASAVCVNPSMHNSEFDLRKAVEGVEGIQGMFQRS